MDPDQPIRQGVPALDAQALAQGLVALPLWRLSQDGRAIRRDWKLRDFAQAAQLAALAAWQAEAANHHPDIAFGWGHLRVSFTTHSAGGVTMNDLIMAARLDRAAE
ncbi:MAG: 4a-hydroxytetrahydrobiopterin dehydratase [Paracoccus sp. (in: a-proteobacteria)]|uniref:4a-hydroxytetrahydrobiopterin dehydratase n=1 Tax=Paracoccus sp. TaxID=267 RepID=UPI0039E544EB